MTQLVGAASCITSITNSNATITRGYYNDNLLNNETSTYGDGIARIVTYGYDPDGRRNGLIYPNSAYSFNYTYTGRGQLNTIFSGSDTVADYGYDLNGNLTSRVLDNFTSSGWGVYDPLNRCTSISHALVGTTRTFAYGYDVPKVGNLGWVRRDGNLGDAFDYDLNDQSMAIKLNIPNPDANGAAGPQSIVYDAGGDRTTFSAYGQTDTYSDNALNQYTTRNGVSAAYDPNGNMTTGFDGSTYTYDAQDRLLTASKGGTTDTFLYDGLNRQIGKKIGNAALFYRVYDGWDLLGEYKTGTSNAFWAYLYGASGIVKNLVTNNYYYQDAMGSTSHVANSVGVLKEYYLYDLQGQPTFYNASGTKLSDTAIGVRHLFAGQQWYSELGLYDLRNRYYSPDIGRFMQSDPVGFGGDANNLYRYCGNNPLSGSDPSGLEEPSVYLPSGNLIGPDGTVTVSGSFPSGVSPMDITPGYVDETAGLGLDPAIGGLNFPGFGPNPLNGLLNNPFGPRSFTIQTGGPQPGSAAFLPAFNTTAPYVQPNQPNDSIIQVQSLPVDQNTNRRDMQPGDLFVSHYGYWGDYTPDTRSQNWIGSRDNQLTVDSLAISDNVARQYNLNFGGSVYVNGIYIGNYDDRAPELNTIDAFDPFYQINQNWGGVMRRGSFTITTGPGG